MSRGKHSSASLHRRHTEAVERVAYLEKALRDEERGHAVTKRIAERVPGLEDRCHQLEQEVVLASSDELKRTRAELEHALEVNETVAKRNDELTRAMVKICDRLRGTWGPDPHAFFAGLADLLGAPRSDPRVSSGPDPVRESRRAKAAGNYARANDLGVRLSNESPAKQEVIARSIARWSAVADEMAEVQE